MSQTAPAQARAGCRRHRAILALLAALAWLAGCTASEPNPSGPTVSARTLAPRAGTATPGQERLGAVPWPADGVSVADMSGIGVADGPGTTRRVPTFGQPGTARTILANALQADHSLVLALDRVLGPGVQSSSRHASEVPLTSHPERHDPRSSPQ